MKEDLVFLIVDTNFSPLNPCINCLPLRIYEKVEKLGVKKWSYLGDFGNKDYDMDFPPIIKPVEDRKFIFFSQRIKTQDSNYQNRFISMRSFNSMELWKKNNTLTRSVLKFPIHLQQNIENSTTRLWILQV